MYIYIYILAPVPLGPLPRKTGSRGEIVTHFGERFHTPAPACTCPTRAAPARLSRVTQGGPGSSAVGVCGEQIHVVSRLLCRLGAGDYATSVAFSLVVSGQCGCGATWPVCCAWGRALQAIWRGRLGSFVGRAFGRSLSPSSCACLVPSFENR